MGIAACGVDRAAADLLSHHKVMGIFCFTMLGGMGLKINSLWDHLTEAAQIPLLATQPTLLTLWMTAALHRKNGAGSEKEWGGRSENKNTQKVR